eukprot:scaffold101774_cov23-Cyclotella_meneghiniana.AAC.1
MGLPRPSTSTRLPCFSKPFATDRSVRSTKTYLTWGSLYSPFDAIGERRSPPTSSNSRSRSSVAKPSGYKPRRDIPCPSASIQPTRSRAARLGQGSLRIPSKTTQALPLLHRPHYGHTASNHDRADPRRQYKRSIKGTSTFDGICLCSNGSGSGRYAWNES